MQVIRRPLCTLNLQCANSSNRNAGAQICDFEDDDVNAEASMLASLGVFDGAAGGSVSDPEFAGRIECCSSKCALPEEVLAGLCFL
jgi:hypothetical protein